MARRPRTALESGGPSWSGITPPIAELVADAETRLVGPRSASLDDVLDAAAAAVSGLGYPDNLATIPENPPSDEFGLPMEMVFRRAAGL